MREEKKQTPHEDEMVEKKPANPPRTPEDRAITAMHLDYWDALIVGWLARNGIGLLSGLFPRVILLLLFGQMMGTLLPLFFFPAETWARFPYAPSLEGQYIIKNMVLVTAALVVGATVRADASFPTRRPRRSRRRRRWTMPGFGGK